VDALLATLLIDMGVDLGPERQALIDLFNAGGRGAVLYRLADDNAQSNPINNRALIDAEYNRAFVATQYFGYLRRDPRHGGFPFLAGSGQQCAFARCAEAACDGLFVHNVGRVSGAV